MHGARWPATRQPIRAPREGAVSWQGKHFMIMGHPADLGVGERRRSRSGRSLKRFAVASMTSAYLGEPATMSVLPLFSRST